MQLNLFQWDRLEAGQGYACLARLDFGQARDHFGRILTGLPGHRVAEAGLQAVEYWEQVFRALAGIGGETAVAFFWQRLRIFSFGDSAVDRELRAKLLSRLQALMEQGGVEYLPPDLCRGYLSLQLGNYVTAENQLRGLIDTVPDQGLLYGYLGDALWLQGRREIAGGVYAVALLLAPEQMAAYTPCNHRLTAIIAQYGAALAPVYGFFRGVLPLVEQEIESDTEAARIYELLRRAERTRHRRDHSAMVAARKEMQALAPGVFADYLRYGQG